MNDTRGRFISLEGLEGVGKTTNRQFVEEMLLDAGIDTIVTREPGGTPLGETLRELVLAADVQMQDLTELLLMTASRVEHVTQLIEPALARGQWVLCDRYLDASIAYQGAGRQLGMARVSQLHQLMGVTCQPDLTLLLDMPVSTGRARVVARSVPDRIERETQAFFERARKGYLELARQSPERIVVIDAGQSLDRVQQQLRDTLMPMMRAC